MPEWLQRFVPEGWGNSEVYIAAVAFTVITAFISLAMVTWVVVRLPADYFVSERSAGRWNQSHALIRWPMLILQHLFEFPGKRRLEAWVLRRRGVSAGINKMRARFGREPLQLDNPPAMP